MSTLVREGPGRIGGSTVRGTKRSVQDHRSVEVGTMGEDQKQVSRREFLQYGAGGAGLLLLAGCGGSSNSSSNKKVKLNALFMKQAAYSDTDVRNMTAQFHK